MNRKKQEEEKNEATPAENPAGVVCAQCSVTLAEVKKCARCKQASYCGRDCQAKHWKEGGHKLACLGFVIAHPLSQFQHSGASSCTISFNNVAYVNDPNINFKTASHLKTKQFIVKVQLPFKDDDSPEEAMVYNSNRSIQGSIYEKEQGYTNIKKKIKKEGFLGMKAFFWAELCSTVPYDGSFKVYYNKCAPFQTW